MCHVEGSAGTKDKEYAPPINFLLFDTQDAQGHRQRELKAAEDGLSKAQKEAEQATAALGNQDQEMATLQLEVEELGKSIASQQEQVVHEHCKCVCLHVHDQC